LKLYKLSSSVSPFFLVLSLGKKLSDFRLYFNNTV
jgi:hypothetical protein